MTQKVVLLWDEDKKIDTGITKLLIEKGFEVLTTEKEHKCFQFLASRHIDIVLLNIHRSDLDGLMLTKRIKSRSKHRHTPIISFTDLDNIMLQPLNISWGCDDYVIKPVDNKRLLKKMDFLIEKYFY